MELKVKERLTGAVILVALVVLLVPELLSGPGNSGTAATQRADQPPLRSFTFSLAEGGSRQTAAPVTASPPKTPVADELSAAVVRPIEEPAPPPPPPVRIKAPEAAPVTGWSIQLGSFVSRDNAQRLVRELKKAGFAAFIAEGSSRSGKLYRVRVGPAADRAAAAALAAKLRSAGQPGSVVPYP